MLLEDVFNHIYVRSARWSMILCYVTVSEDAVDDVADDIIRYRTLF